MKMKKAMSGALVCALLATLPLLRAAVAQEHDPIIVAAGDIACDPQAPASAKGDDDSGPGCAQRATAALIAAQHPDAVLTIGDEQYPSGAYASFERGYAPTWGRFREITHPVPGNHEYGTPGAAGYFKYFGEAAGDPARGYYSYDLGSWHVVALNGNCAHVGGCGVNSPQERWLKADLADHRTPCTLAYWHQPRFSSGPHHSDATYDAFWQDLYAASADVVLNGHDHDYERFDPQRPDATADPSGITEFVVGTGGRSHYTFGTIEPNSSIHDNTTFGILVLTLHAHSFEWNFVPARANGFTDSGTTDCHGA